MKTICLNMIVKDESPVILRLLNSVKPIIDYWVIADTGSTDGTELLIQEFMKEIPGKLLRRPWVDFAHNRNEVITSTQGKWDYILFIDADETLLFHSPFNKSLLTKDYYLIRACGKTSEFTKIFLVKANLPWRWKGVLHESISHIPGTSARQSMGLKLYTTNSPAAVRKIPKNSSKMPKY